MADGWVANLPPHFGGCADDMEGMATHTMEALSKVVKTVKLRYKYLMRPPFAFLYVLLPLPSPNFHLTRSLLLHAKTLGHHGCSTPDWFRGSTVYARGGEYREVSEEGDKDRLPQQNCRLR